MSFRSISIALSILTIASLAYAENLKIWPVFSPALDAPEFMVDYTNTSNEMIDIPRLIQESSIILDGSEYKLAIFKFGGGTNLKPGDTWTYKFSPDSYMIGAEKRSYSKILGRWRWQTALKPGQHTLVLTLGGQKSESVTFLWEGNVPLLYK